MKTRSIIASLMLLMLASTAYAGSCRAFQDPNFTCTSLRTGVGGVDGNATVNWGSAYAPGAAANPTTDKAFWAAYAVSNFNSQNGASLAVNGLAGTGTLSHATQADANGDNGDWVGSFSPGDNLLHNSNSTGVSELFINIQALPGTAGVYALGFQIQSLLNEGGAPFGFTAAVYVYGDSHLFSEDNGVSTGTVSSSNLLGGYSISVDDGSGTNGPGPFDLSSNDTTADNTAPFLGVFATMPISSVLIVADSEDAGTEDFAINQMDLQLTSTTTDAPAPDAGDVPEPGTLLLLGSGLALVWRRFGLR